MNESNEDVSFSILFSYFNRLLNTFPVSANFKLETSLSGDGRHYQLKMDVKNVTSSFREP
ncbi:MAG: hypothetical protein ACTSVI_06600 [Promethearchaeota archaeon]